MMKILLIGGLASILTAITGTLLALRLQYRWLSKDRIEREAWERAQEMHQINWEKQQRKRATELEWSVVSQVEQIQEQWSEWESRDRDRVNRVRLEYELLHLPAIDEMPLALQSPEHAYSLPAEWRPPMLDRADLRGHDFSHRYLGHAHLRQADLTGANFYMADLRNTCLLGANLSEAVLTGANLSGADLRGAILRGASLLAADLRGALLHGADLRDARSLTIQQVHEAHCDHTTLLDPEIDCTMPRLPAQRSSISDPDIMPGLFQQVLESPLLLPQASDDSSRDAFHPAETSESGGEAGTAIPTTRQNGTQRARVH